MPINRAEPHPAVPLSVNLNVIEFVSMGEGNAGASQIPSDPLTPAILPGNPVLKSYRYKLSLGEISNQSNVILLVALNAVYGEIATL